MGTATCELHKSAIIRLKSPPYSYALLILQEDHLEGDLFLVRFSSQLLPEDKHYGTVEIVITDDGVRIKRWNET
jgi:hypothetical protein